MNDEEVVSSLDAVGGIGGKASVEQRAVVKAIRTPDLYASLRAIEKRVSEILAATGWGDLWPEERRIWLLSEMKRWREDVVS